MKHEAWSLWADRIGLGLTPAQSDLLSAFEAFVLERALPFGMVGTGDRDRLRDRHVVDSLRAAPLLEQGPGTALDIGSGAGFPGMPLAIVRPDLRFCLAEIRRRRSAFLEMVVDELRLTNVVVFSGDAGNLESTFDTCLSRAFADPHRAWKIAEPLLVPAGRLLFWAGRGFEVASGTPAGARISLSADRTLADAGPVVIMTRQ